MKKLQLASAIGSMGSALANARDAVKENALRVSVGALTAMPLLAMAVDPTTPEEAITQGRTAVVAIIAIGGLAMVIIALAAVGWGVGTKFIKRLRGAA